MKRPVSTGIRLGLRWKVLQLAFLIAAALPWAGLSLEGFRYNREIRVPTAGWVRVPLDLTTLQHLAPGAADLHVLSPAGGDVPFTVEHAAPRSERRSLPAPRPERVDDGWEARIDLGPDPLPHERLLLQGSGRAGLDGIESSPDGAAWRPLAATTGSPRETEEEEDGAPYSYPATGDRYLRLHWPRQPTAPRVTDAEVESVTGPVMAVTSRDSECEAMTAGRIACALTLPAAGQTVRRLTVDVAGGGRMGFRLEAPSAANWRTMAEGVWQSREGTTRHLIAGDSEPVADALLRLELYGSAQSPPRLVSWGLEISIQTVLFRAEEPGVYVLAYGGGGRGKGRRADPKPVDFEASWLEAGAETELTPPPLPISATAPGILLGSRRLTAAWKVVAPTAAPGTLVRLELPDTVYRAARADLGNLRLVMGERQIPFFRWSPAAPALVARFPDLDLHGNSRKSKESEGEIRLPEPGLPVTGLNLLASARPIRRTVTVRYPEAEGGSARRDNGKRRNRSTPLRQVWECRPQPPLPCLERLALSGHAPQTLSLRFQDGDNPPLADLEATVWRRRDVLLFVWPDAEETTPVRLLAGPETLRSPSYDLATLGDILLSHPWQPAELSEASATSGEPRWARWIMPLTLVIAGLGLIVLLARILSER